MTKQLFDIFPEVSAAQWKQKIQYDLKGDDYNNTLIWTSNEGINVKPFYHPDDFSSINQDGASTHKKWNINQTIYAGNSQMANKKALEAIEKGAESIKFLIADNSININQLLKNIDLTKTIVYLDCLFLSPDYIKAISKNNLDSLIITADIIQNLCKTGNWYKDYTFDQANFIEIIKATNTITINSSLYQNAGANMVQELAYSLAHAYEYLNLLNNEFNESQKQTLKVVFEISVGSNYFFEIAKIKALRILWKSLAEEFSVNSDCIIFVTPSNRNKTIYDYNINMLRTTTECMSAILGGANTICNSPYDAIYHKDNDFGERIARNQLLILKHESYFDKVTNAADGTYYIENLINQLCEKALNLFKDIEANGGFLSQLKSGTIQRKIKESAQLEQAQFNKGELILLGTNRHPNPEDKMKHELELFPFVKRNPRKTLIEPIIEKRLAEETEQNRLNNE
ncbi:methylmalonyl-CoA mutase subunit beta [Paucihalobacter sp.]|uniref:methylmalonyl-CoA mutase subunit beta n=1 Tax=Paucihalobacter sp. TaxID=2850405 RepID=UPI002FE08266